ncbi:MULTISPECIES: hypothetical protein [Salinibaculum]|uniref:hypothetical protein n=1 Tax=Salinibaculum TaxID=2732368 RepID=UPI0030D0413F
MNFRLVPLPTPPTAWDTVAGGIRRLAFWAAVLMPLVYVPLLSSPVTDSELLAFAGLVAVHVGCLLVGHDYSP